MADLCPTTPLISSSPLTNRLSVLRRLRYNATLYIVKFLIDIGLWLGNLPGIRNNLTQPTLIKAYSCHPRLTNRIFIPKSHKTGGAALPLYLDIHGGGFAWASPVVDDKFCSDLSDNNNFLVVSLDYPKSPSHRFPNAVQALSNLVNAILQDDHLPIDRAKVAIGGFSAGGNLAFAVCQDESLQGKIKGIVAFYPPVNIAIKPIDKRAIAAQPPNYGSVLPQDQLAMFKWGYVKEGQDLTDPMVSPIYARRERLPPKMFIIGCELDILCREAEIMAEGMARIDIEQEAGGQRDSQQGGAEQSNGASPAWEKNGVKWEKVLSEDHGV